MAKRHREIRLQCRVTADEKSAVERNMKELGTKNTEAYLRKMAIDGYIVQIDTSDIRELVRLLRVTSNSLNQIARMANATGTVHSADIERLIKSYDRLWALAEETMLRMASI